MKKPVRLEINNSGAWKVNTMTTITVNKVLLERALEALEIATDNYDDSATGLEVEAIFALRDALAAPATAAEFPANLARMIHYPECWDTAAYPELRDAIHEALAWSGCSVCSPATAPDELERLKAESEKRLQNCVALVAEVERLRAAPATAPAQPAWHDAPTCAGAWINEVSMRAMPISANILKAWGSAGSRWYGPIPEDKL